MRDIDDSYVRLLRKWQREQKEADRIRRDEHAQVVFNRACYAALVVLFGITMIIAYIGGI